LRRSRSGPRSSPERGGQAARGPGSRVSLVVTSGPRSCIVVAERAMVPARRTRQVAAWKGGAYERWDTPERQGLAGVESDPGSLIFGSGRATLGSTSPCFVPRTTWESPLIVDRGSMLPHRRERPCSCCVALVHPSSPSADGQFATTPAPEKGCAQSR
jgi:hypothetical protein